MRIYENCLAYKNQIKNSWNKNWKKNIFEKIRKKYYLHLKIFINSRR